MTPERWQRINDVFARAVPLTQSEREIFVRESCGTDRELYGEVMALLTSEDEASRSLRSVVFSGERITAGGATRRRRFTSSGPESGPATDRIGDRFAIRRELGAGGMGVV